ARATSTSTCSRAERSTAAPRSSSTAPPPGDGRKLLAAGRTVGRGLAAHDLGHRRAAGHAVHRAREVETFLNRPQLAVLVGSEQLCRLAGGGPAGGERGERGG